MKRFAKQLPFVAAMLLLSTCVLAQEPEGPKLTLCTVANSIERYNHQSITVRARVQSDGTHGVQIYDDSCGQFGVGLEVPDEAKGRAELIAALDKGYRGTHGKTIYATFTGEFEVQSEEPHRRIIKVQKIESVTVEMNQNHSSAKGPGADGLPTVALHESGHVAPPKEQ